MPSCLPSRRTCCDPWRKSFRGVNGGVAETQGSRASMAPADFGDAAVGFYVKLSVPIEASTHFACGKYERAIKPFWDVNCLEMIPVHMLLHPGGLWVAIAIPSYL